jgi:NAD(P)-dependent dehydrogenase (short-subunit alcohol dehydrogenase family)
VFGARLGMGDELRIRPGLDTDTPTLAALPNEIIYLRRNKIKKPTPTSNTNGRLSGRVVIVTGGGRGLGRAMALALAGAGARVIVTAAREGAEIEMVAAEAVDGVILPMLADVTHPEDCAIVVRAAFERFGRLDLLVNNAARGMKYVSENFLTQPTRFWEADPEGWSARCVGNATSATGSGNGMRGMGMAAAPGASDGKGLSLPVSAARGSPSWSASLTTLSRRSSARLFWYLR